MSLNNFFSNIQQPSYHPADLVIGDLFPESNVVIQELSPGSVQKIVFILNNFQKEHEHARQGWRSILRLAYEKKRLPLFDKEILSRLDCPNHLLLQDIIWQILEKIFFSTENVIDCFLRLATTYRTKYYPQETFVNILQDFSKLIDTIENLQMPSYSTNVPCYDQNGKEWIERCIMTLHNAKSAQDQVELWSGLPSSPQISLARHFNFRLIHSEAFHAPIVGTHHKATIELSVQNLFSRTIRGTAQQNLQGTPVKKFLDFGHLLEAADLQDIFTESDRLHLLQILIYLTNQVQNKHKIGSEQALIQWFKAVKEVCGDSCFFLITKPACYQTNASLEMTTQLMQILIEINDPERETIPYLLEFYNQNISLGNVLQQLYSIQRKKEEKRNSEKDLEGVLEAFSTIGASSSVDFPLNQNELREIEIEYKEISRICLELSLATIGQLVQQVKEIKARCQTRCIDIKDKLTLIAIGREAIRIKFGIYPYNTQILSLLGILQHPATMKGRIAQVRTGEGKSLLITLLAFYFACQNKTVDIITSSRYLAQRDQLRFENFFITFEIPSSHICVDNPAPEQFMGQILYGTNSDFEFAIMRDYLFKSGLRKIECFDQNIPRPFDLVIVDEVDNLFIDCAFNAARIAIPGDTKISWIYPLILAYVKKNHIEIGRILRLEQQLKQSQIQEFALLLQEEICSLQQGESAKRARSIEIQKYANWIESAYIALYQKKLNEDYVIKIIDSRTKSKKNDKAQIVIVDKKITGRLIENSRWTKGLHEFLEAKHGLLIKEEGLTTASLSHSIFFNYYKNVYGFTGTIGTEIERKEIQDCFQVDTFDTPLHRENIRTTLDTLVLNTKEEFFQNLLDEVKMIQEQNRPILIIFDTIKKTKSFAAFLEEHQIQSQLLNELQAENEEYIIAKAGAPRIPTIATNDAGRGTDIIPLPESLKNGGLHVVFTFYPDNDRVEQQGIGRASRQGQPGSARMILCLNISDYIPLQSNIISVVPTVNEYLEILQASRRARLEALSNNRRELTAINMIQHNYLQQFFEKMQYWHDMVSPSFLNEVNLTLVQVIKEYNFNSEDRLITVDFEEQELQAHQLFLQQARLPYSDNQSWTFFLQMVSAALVTKIQQNWAQFFYEKLDDLYENIKISTDENRIIYYAEQIEDLHQSVKIHWEGYLTRPKDGFIRYLKHISGDVIFNENSSATTRSISQG